MLPAVSCAKADSDPNRGIQVILEALHLQNRRVLLNTAVNRKELQRRKALLFLHRPNLDHTVNISANTLHHRCNEVTVSMPAGAMETCHYIFTSLSKGSHAQKDIFLPIHSLLMKKILIGSTWHWKQLLNLLWTKSYSEMHSSLKWVFSPWELIWAQRLKVNWPFPDMLLWQSITC